MKPFVIEGGKWRIKSDEECYALQKARSVSGRLKWEAEGYYTTLAQVLTGCLRKKILNSEEELPVALREAVEVMRDAEDRLRREFSIGLVLPPKDGQEPQRTDVLV